MVECTHRMLHCRLRQTGQQSIVAQAILASARSSCGSHSFEAAILSGCTFLPITIKPGKPSSRAPEQREVLKPVGTIHEAA